MEPGAAGSADGAPSGAEVGPSISERARAIYVYANEKGGMQNINKDVINRIVMETSGNSAYTERQLKQDRKVDERIVKLRHALAQLDHGSRRRTLERAVATRTAALERSRQWQRWCCVIDFDMFYAAVEIRDRCARNPPLPLPQCTPSQSSSSSSVHIRLLTDPGRVVMISHDQSC